MYTRYVSNYGEEEIRESAKLLLNPKKRKLIDALIFLDEETDIEDKKVKMTILNTFVDPELLKVKLAEEAHEAYVAKVKQRFKERKEKEMQINHEFKFNIIPGEVTSLGINLPTMQKKKGKRFAIDLKGKRHEITGRYTVVRDGVISVTPPAADNVYTDLVTGAVMPDHSRWFVGHFDITTHLRLGNMFCYRVSDRVFIWNVRENSFTHQYTGEFRTCVIDKDGNYLGKDRIVIDINSDIAFMLSRHKEGTVVDIFKKKEYSLVSSVILKNVTDTFIVYENGTFWFDEVYSDHNYSACKYTLKRKTFNLQFRDLARFNLIKHFITDINLQTIIYSFLSPFKLNLD